MIHPTSRTTPGFTAVELLVTLFVAAIFLMIGYQLFNVIIRDGGDTRAQSSAGNVAYEYLRRYSSNSQNPCTPSTPVTGASANVEGAASATVSVAISCTQGDAPAVSKVEAVVTYTIGTETKTAQFATFVDMSKGAVASNQQDITDGLIGWWKMNGNSESSIGSYHGNPFTTVTTHPGQNGQWAGSLGFNGTNGRITVPTVDMPKPTLDFTVSAWVYPTAASGSSTLNIVSNTNGAATGGWSMTVGPPCLANTVRFKAARSSSTFFSACTASGTFVQNRWNLIVARVYIEGISTHMQIYFTNAAGTAMQSVYAGSISSTTNMYWHDTNEPLCIGASVSSGIYCSAASTFFNGRIDDIRYYSRALSVSEINQLFANGAR